MREIANGIQACGGKASGTARLVLSARDFEKVKQGDVLIAEYTTPEFHHILMKAAAVVTIAGGRLSHSAIVARELGIPCIVGVKKAFETIKDGKTILVDGNEGKIFEL